MNVINTKLNLTWSAREAKVMEVFKFKDTEAQHRFHDLTTITTELSYIVDNDKPLEVVSKKLVKRIKSFTHKSFKKVRIVDKPDSILEALYNERRLLRNKKDAQSVEILKLLMKNYVENIQKPCSVRSWVK